MDFSFTAAGGPCGPELLGPPPSINTGNDILDIGSRKAQARRQRTSAGVIGGDMIGPAPIQMMGMPGHFDLPNVANVRK